MLPQGFDEEEGSCFVDDSFVCNASMPICPVSGRKEKEQMIAVVPGFA